MERDFVARAKTEEEILRQATEDVQTVHDMKEIPEELDEKGRAAIRDE